jgi:plasmid stability protein
VVVTDILIRDVPDEIVAALDAKAARAGLSRTEYLRRALAREVSDGSAVVSVEDLKRFAETFADLGDSEVMGQAWS